MICSSAFGQSIKSPYTIFGVGDIVNERLAQNEAMGGLGIGYSSLRFINLANPAWNYRNGLSTFQIALEGESRSLATQDLRESSGAAGLRYLLLSVPLANRVSTSFGILPYSTVNYDITSDQIVPESEAEYEINYLGRGGLSQLFWTNSVRITEGLGLGLKAKYIFGEITTEDRISIVAGDISSSYKATYEESTSYSDLNLTAGLSYRWKMTEENILNFGATYDLSSSLKGRRDILIQRTTLTNSIIRQDTLGFNEKVNFTIPNSLAIGVSFEKLNLFTVGADITMQDWVEDGGFDQKVFEYQKSMKFSVGAEYVPEYDNVNSYFKRAVYRAGFFYNQVPYLVKGVKINDFGINFGSSLPVSGLSSLDFTLKFGQRGTLDNELIRERYFKFVLGATINDRWFIRRKYD